VGTLQRTNGFLEKWIFLIMPLLIATGIFGDKGVADGIEAVPFLFMVLTFLSSLSADFRSFGRVFRRPVRFFAFLAAIHFLIPWAVYGVARLCFAAQSDLATGITLTAILPLGVTSIFWVAYNKANLEAAVAYVSLNTILSPILVPLAFVWILGSQISLDTGQLVGSLVRLVLIPACLGMGAGEWLRRKEPAPWLKPGAAFLNKLCLFAIVLLNAASVSEQLDVVRAHIFVLLLAVPSVMSFGYLVSYMLGRWLSSDRKMQIAIAYSGGVRNYTVGIVLAAAFFPPAAGIPVLLAMLFQHPLALLVYYVFKWTKGKGKPDTASLRSSLSRFGG